MLLGQKDESKYQKARNWSSNTELYNMWMCKWHRHEKDDFLSCDSWVFSPDEDDAGMCLTSDVTPANTFLSVWLSVKEMYALPLRRRADSETWTLAFTWKKGIWSGIIHSSQGNRSTAAMLFFVTATCWLTVTQTAGVEGSEAATSDHGDSLIESGNEGK